MYGGLLVGLPDPNALELHGYDTEDHRTQCRDLALKGYRPIAIAAASESSGKQTMAASVWQLSGEPSVTSATPRSSNTTPTSTPEMPAVTVAEPPTTLSEARLPVPSGEDRKAGSSKVKDIFAKDLLKRGKEEQDTAAKFALQQFPASCLSVGRVTGCNCSDERIRKLAGGGEVVLACGSVELEKAAAFSLFVLLPGHLSSTSAQTLTTRRGGRPRENCRGCEEEVVRRTESRNSRPAT
jgi:hypothetical protein